MFALLAPMKNLRNSFCDTVWQAFFSSSSFEAIMVFLFKKTTKMKTMGATMVIMSYFGINIHMPFKKFPMAHRQRCIAVKNLMVLADFKQGCRKVGSVGFWLLPIQNFGSRFLVTIHTLCSQVKLFLISHICVCSIWTFYLSYLPHQKGAAS